MKKILTGFIIGVIITSCIASGIWLVIRKPADIIPPKVITKIDTVFVEKEIIIYKTITKAKIDTIFIENKPAEIVASTTFEIEQDDIRGSLSVEFEYFSQMFTLKSTNLIYTGEIVTNETIKTEYVKEPIKRFTPLISAGYWQSEGKYTVSLGIGFRLYNKIDLIANANSQKELGIVANWRM